MYENLLKNIESIQPLSSYSASLFTAKAVVINIKKNDYLLTEGQVCKHVYYVQNGCLRTYYNKEGKDINLSFSLADNFVSNLKSLRLDTASEVYIQACEDSIVISFKKDDLFALYKQSDEISAFGRNLLEKLLMEQEEHSNLFKLKSPVERYRYIQERHPEILQKISLTQLSSYLGISRETLGRIRRIV